ncbi:major capsid protein [Sigmofec virus UA08Rod_6706]|uniref:Major capsid protein n=1 Tax=Sigmofec virus UA08Rod_6706 TaxID=2929237 RepID=A0A976N085_9VIRU|nr:major capsid protein [Sigmofec virus UA08Rod_6706]
MAQSIFRQIKRQRLPRTGFDLSFNNKLTCGMGTLIPILIQDVVPGDTFKVNSSIFMRMAPMIAPMMTRVRIYTHYFFVPKRLLWTHWKDFITGQPQDESRINALESEESGEYIPPEYPYYVIDTEKRADDVFSARSLCDYLGFPVFDADNRADFWSDSGYPEIKIDALPIKAYNLIWNEFYRDQSLQKPLHLRLATDGLQDVSDDDLKYIFSLKRRAWKKDYFTSALPFAQAGPDVELPMSGNASIKGTGFQRLNQTSQGDGITAFWNKSGSHNDRAVFQNSRYIQNQNQVIDPPYILGDVKSSHARSTYGVSDTNNEDGQVYQDLPVDSNGNYIHGIDVQNMAHKLQVDLSNVNSATINELRRAFAAQRFLEAEARGGSRYIEELYSIFGVKSSDATLQRPQYLGGGAQDIVVSDVLQTSATVPNQSPQANQAGVGASLGRSHSFNRNFEEHGYIIGLMSILPDASYMQGFPKMFTKFDRLDHYWPQFAHLGEQEIKESELFFVGQDFTDQDGAVLDPVFGYTPRYAEYKFNLDQIHGDFRGSLSFWHLARRFQDRPKLNGSFISANPSNRIFAVETDSFSDHFWFNIQHNIKAIRSMPRFGTPV